LHRERQCRNRPTSPATLKSLAQRVLLATWRSVRLNPFLNAHRITANLQRDGIRRHSVGVKRLGARLRPEK